MAVEINARIKGRAYVESENKVLGRGEYVGSLRERKTGKQKFP
jgi:hypothetical protein